MEVTEAVERGDRRWWVRLRSAGLLAALLAFLGVTVAAVVGVLALAVTVLIDRALG